MSGWNRPSEKPQQAAKKPSIWRGIIAGVAVVVLGVAAIFIFKGDESPVSKSEKKGGRIKEVAPAVTNQAPAVADKKPWPDKPPHKDGIWRHGEGPRSIAVTNGCTVTYPNDPSVRLTLPHPKFRPPFRNLCDNEIASLVTLKPGQTLIETPMPHNFDEMFKKVIQEKIEITDEDTPEKAELKRQVIEAREILKEAMERGESPRKILLEERKNLRHLMAIRDNYQHMVDEQIKNHASDQEIADTVNAANMLLEKKGITTKVRLPYPTKLRLDQAKKDGTVEDIKDWQDKPNNEENKE